MSRYVEIRRDQQKQEQQQQQQERSESSTSWDKRMLASLRQDQPQTSTSWEERMLAGLSSLRKNPAESKIETSTSWEERMLVREAGGRLQVASRRDEKDEEQREKEVKCDSLSLSLFCLYILEWFLTALFFRTKLNTSRNLMQMDSS